MDLGPLDWDPARGIFLLMREKVRKCEYTSTFLVSLNLYASLGCKIRTYRKLESVQRWEHEIYKRGGDGGDEWGRGIGGEE